MKSFIVSSFVINQTGCKQTPAGLCVVVGVSAGAAVGGASPSSSDWRCVTEHVCFNGA